MLTYPHFDPIALALGPLKIHWYGLMYLLAFAGFLLIGRLRLKQLPRLGWHTGDLDDLLFYGVLGVILGGRLGYILFYKPTYYFAEPFAHLGIGAGILEMLHRIIAVWEGGMAFHGGLLGVLIAMVFFARKKGVSWLTVTDFIAPTVPFGLMTGRIGNFINGELWGRVSSPNLPWGMIFPSAKQADIELSHGQPLLQELIAQFGGLPRHPSQLYQAALEGLVLLIIMLVYSRNPRRTGAVSAVFLLGYGSFRFLAEFARQPDDFLGPLALGLSMGQWLSVPMIVIGAWMWKVAHRPKNASFS